MAEKSVLYFTTKQAKNGDSVPVFKSGKSCNSLYNPQHEADMLVSTCKESDFYLIAGIGAGFIIESIFSKNKNAFILIAENSEKDINFLQQFPLINKYISYSCVKIFPVYQTAKMIQKYYLPALYGNMQIIELRTWADENPEGISLFRSQVKEASSSVSADFSVQAHFGKIWQRNIMLNLREADTFSDFKFPLKKTALIAAAGPSLDVTFEYIKNHREELYIIATDTAYGSFCRRGIFCDAVISIDGQTISYSHFLSKIQPETLFIFDLCANHSAVKKIKKANGKIIFIRTGHPLSSYASLFAGDAFPLLDSGAGTVTISAADFAYKAGFKKLAVAGADFAYSAGKSYMKGTYLDTLYLCQSSRKYSFETIFDRLLFRAPMYPVKGKIKTFTTTVLDSYKKTFLAWMLEKHFISEEKDGLLYCIFQEKEKKENNCLSVKPFNFSRFSAYITHSFSLDTEPDILLPIIAYFRTSQKITNIETLKKLAYSELLRYT